MARRALLRKGCVPSRAENDREQISPEAPPASGFLYRPFEHAGGQELSPDPSFPKPLQKLAPKIDSLGVYGL